MVYLLSMGTVPKMNLNAVCMLDTCFRVGFIHTSNTTQRSKKEKETQHAKTVRSAV